MNNMRLSMNKMNNDFTYLATQERQRNAHLGSRLTSLESHLQAARQDVNALRKERQELQNILQAYKDENRKLYSEKEHWEIERRILTGVEGRRGDSLLPQIDMNKVLGAVTEQVSKEMEEKMSAILDQIEEQKSLRNQAEQRFAKTLRHLGHVSSTSLGDTRSYVYKIPNREPSVQQSPYIPAQSPSLQRGSHSPTSTYVVSPIAKSPVNTSGTHQGASDYVSGPITFADRRSMTPRTVHVAETHTRDSPRNLRDLPSPTCRRTSSCDNQEPRKKPRLMDEGEVECSSPNPLPSSSPEGIKSGHNENVLSPIQISEPKDGDVIRNDVEDDGSVTIKPEPLEDADVDMNIDHEGSKEVTPSSPHTTSTNPRPWAPIREPTPKPVSHRAFKTANIPNLPPANQRNNKLGIGHIDLLYRTDNGMMTCRMCLYVHFSPDYSWCKFRKSVVLLSIPTDRVQGTSSSHEVKSLL